MAPSRRRGGGKAAAAAAAARRQWKVGDLVLAKLKGFPAWPATVSKPEKWGYPPDLKKVLVYFFGTQQIAFCNPADVEAFTEEKKQSLLVKRQGKGADFVRAVQEIMDSYEKSKKQNQIDDFNQGGEVTNASDGNSEELSSHFELNLKDRREACQATAADRNNPTLQMDKVVDMAQITSFHEKEPLLEQAINNVVATGKPTITTYTSRKRSEGLRSRKRITEQKAAAPESSRSSSLLDSCRFQNFAMPSDDANGHAGGASTNLILGSLQSNKQIRKSPDGSGCDDVDMSAVVLSDSIEEHGSEIATVDSDSFSLNEGSTIDSICKEHSESVVECLEGDELTKVLDFRIEAVVKKKRKPIRKRVTNGAAEPSKGEADLEVVVPNLRQASENACENLNERYNREEGDEHLPLVKRARVRMGKPLPFQEENNTFSIAEEKASTGVAVKQFEEQNTFCQAVERTSHAVAASSLEPVSPSTDFNDECPADRDSFLVKSDLEKLSPLKDCTEIFGNGPQVFKDKENQSFGCSDGEAALPPSKRLHRALEAMSVNAAEEGHLCAESSKRRMLSNGNSTLNVMSSLTTAGEELCGSGKRSQDSFGCKASGSCSVAVIEESIKSSSVADICSQSIEISERGPCQDVFVGESCKDVFSGAVDHDKIKDLVGPGSGIDAGGLTIEAKGSRNLTPYIDTGQGILQTCGGSPKQLVLAKDEDNSEEVELRGSGGKIHGEKLEKSEHSAMRQHFLPQSAEATTPNAADGLQQGVEGTDFLRSQTDYYSQSNSLCDGAIDAKRDQGQETGYSFGAIDCLGENDSSHVQLSPLPAVCLDRTSPPAATLCDVSTSESANSIQNSVYSSPKTHSHHKRGLCTSVADEENVEMAMSQRPKSASKWSDCAEAHSALSSFEAVLGSLTRTKESIGRATRMAINCAKFGASSKVVEILAHSLESESSLHKRVDLFFLVDSITQCSRGLKGDFGGVYPSAIQAALPRLLSAAAPRGSYAQENRRQCLKVLRLWLERRILPESVIHHHIRELDSVVVSSSAGAYSRRSARTERSLDDPVRDMEGMLVDEYGSNSSFQLLGFCMPRMLKDEDEGSESDGEGFEAVTPENRSGNEERETNPAMEKHTHILEDVDGELEMEDVAPSCDNVVQDQDLPRTVSHPPEDVPCSSPPLPSSSPTPRPPPPRPPPPPLTARVSCNMQDGFRHQQSDATRINPSVSNAAHYHAPEGRNPTWKQVCDSTGSCNGYPLRTFNDVQHTDGRSFYHKPYPSRPPHNHPPPHQFSYVQPGHYTRSRRETPPPSYSHRFHSSHNNDAGKFYDNNERMRTFPYERGENWRFPPPSFHGPQYPEKAKASYGSGAYGGPPREPSRWHHQGWECPPRGMHNRNFVPFRPPFDSAVPVANRAPDMWRPR